MNWELVDKHLRSDKDARLTEYNLGNGKWELKRFCNGKEIFTKIHPKVAKALIIRDLLVIASKDALHTVYRHHYT